MADSSRHTAKVEHSSLTVNSNIKKVTIHDQKVENQCETLDVVKLPFLLSADMNLITLQ